MSRRKSFFSGLALSLKLIMAVLFVFSIVACQTGTILTTDNPPANKEEKPKENPYANAEITTKVMLSVNNTYGYDILLYGKPLVHQPNIPGLPGNEGFATQERAQTVAEFVMKKIRNNEMPPTVSIDDLNTLEVLK